MTAELQRLFQSCDKDAIRSVDRDAFRDLCHRLNISNQDSDVIFEDLDHDRDGRISFADFSRGFSDFVETVESRGSNLENGDFEEEECFEDEPDVDTKHQVWSVLTTEAERVGKKYSDEGKLKWLLSELQMSEQRHLVPHLQGAIEELLTSYHQLLDEKEHLEDSWKREKLEHERHLKRMEEELDNQVKEAEMRLRLKAQAEVEDERKSLQSKMEVKMENLQSHLVLFEKVNTWLQSQPSDQRDVELDEALSKLDKAVAEKRKMHMSLLDWQTSFALVQSENLQLRTMLEEKCRECVSEKEKNNEVMQEHNHLSRQLNLLHETNRRLLDSHDALRNSAESSAIKSNADVIDEIPRKKRGSIIGDYLDLGPPKSPFLDGFQENEENDCDVSGCLRRAKSMDITLCAVQRGSTNFDRRLVEQSPNHSDSGVFTVREPSEADEVFDMPIRNHVDSDTEQEWKLRRNSNGTETSERDRNSNDIVMKNVEEARKQKNTDVKNNANGVKFIVCHSSSVETEAFPKRKISDIKKQLGIEDTSANKNWRRSWSPSPKRYAPSNVKSSLSIPPTPMPRLSKMSQRDIKQCQTDRKSLDTDDEDKLCAEDSLEKFAGEFEPTGPAEQTFKVIFIGDAGVGKSSFALRISKGVFVRHMSSTLGVDFLMRTIRVDGRNVAVQLWDTAGQERFRSITKSYFRKADGVMLLYDCTCEQSFISVRQWVEDVDTVANQRIPLMIVGNKTDLREMALKTGTSCITSEQGESLAKDCDTTFMEASAKDGSNVLQALANLVRSMSNLQELQMTASTMDLRDPGKKKSGGCCGK